MTLAEAITIVIPTSPIPSHPSTSLIEMTIQAIRRHLPDCPILIQADGVRPEQEKFSDQYKAYLLRLDDAINAGKFGNCKMRRFPAFRHQAAMMKESLSGWVGTPYVYYQEHDLPLLPEYVDWQGIVRAIGSGRVNKIRLHYWSMIVPEHQHLMLDKEPIFIEGVPLIRTIQWSQHPHVISKNFYEKILSNFSPDCRTMIETRAYGLAAAAPWDEMRMAIYAPTPYLKRIWHSHGREEESKYEETFTF
jgi:hypothetical protein